MKRDKKQKLVEGAIVRVPYEPGRHTYAQLLVEPWIRVFDAPSGDEADDLERVISSPVLFTVATQPFAVSDGRWPVVGHAPLRREERRIPDQFVQDLFNPSKLRVLSGSPDGSWQERPATIAECEGLEAASVWDPEHVETRIADHYAGRVNLTLLVNRLVRPGEVFTILIDREQNAVGDWVVSGRAHAPIHVGDRVSVGGQDAPALVVAGIKTYPGDADAPPLVSGQSGTLHLTGDVSRETRAKRILLKCPLSARKPG